MISGFAAHASIYCRRPNLIGYSGCVDDNKSRRKRKKISYNRYEGINYFVIADDINVGRSCSHPAAADSYMTYESPPNCILDNYLLITIYPVSRYYAYRYSFWHSSFMNTRHRTMTSLSLRCYCPTMSSNEEKIMNLITYHG